jgi:acyl dehydratase
MGIAVQVAVDSFGGSGQILDYQVRFTKPVLVDAKDGALLSVSATVSEVDEPAGTVRLSLMATSGGQTVLGKAQVLVRL